MLGNTNVKDGINLNATVVTKEVDTNQSIVAGNFVQYKTISSSISLPRADFANANSKVIVLSNGYALMLPYLGGGYFTLVRLDGLNSEVLDTYHFDNYVIDFDVDENGNIYAITSANSGNGNTLKRLAIESDLFVVKQTITLDLYARKIFVLKDKGVSAQGEAIVTFNYSPASTNQPLYINYLTITNGVMSKSSSATNTTWAERNVIESAMKVDGCLTTRRYATGYTFYYRYRMLDVSNPSLIREEMYQYQESVNLYGSNGEYVIGYGSDNNYRLININTKVYETFVFEGDGTTLTPYTIGYMAQDIIILVASKKICLCRIDHTLKRIFLISNILDYSSYELVGMSFHYDENIYMNCRHSSSSYEFTSDILGYTTNYDEISAFQDKNVVQNWTGDYHLIGVAKQSGVAGDTIEVYIPSV